MLPQTIGFPPRPRAYAAMPPAATMSKTISNIAPPNSDNNGFLVFAEDAAEGVGDFADGGVGFDGGEDGGEEILGSGGAPLEFGEGGFGAGGVALGAESVEAGDLGTFDFGVDAENRNGAGGISI